MPIDIVAMIVNFSMSSHIDLLKVSPLTKSNLTISLLVANNEKLWEDLIPEFKKILESCCPGSNYSKELEESIRQCLDIVNYNRTWVKLTEDLGIMDKISELDEEDIKKFLKKEYKIDNEKLLSNLALDLRSLVSKLV